MIVEQRQGVGHRVTGRIWDQACEHPLRDLGELDAYRFPNVAASERFTWLGPYVDRASAAGKYVVGFNPVLMFEKVRALMGFEELMLAPYTQPEGLEELLDRLADLTVDVIGRWRELGGVDGFMTWEDWGLQSGLQMKLATFRQYYKPRYARVVRAAHDCGMHFIWHNCGDVMQMIPDMIEIGVDVLQLDQSRLMGHERLAGAFGGKVCFWNTVDVQWSAEADVTIDDLKREVAEMTTVYNRFNGGFMARHYPDAKDINLADERQVAISEAFLEHGCTI